MAPQSIATSNDITPTAARNLGNLLVDGITADNPDDVAFSAMLVLEQVNSGIEAIGQLLEHVGDNGEPIKPATLRGLGGLIQHLSAFDQRLHCIEESARFTEAQDQLASHGSGSCTLSRVQQRQLMREHLDSAPA